MTGMSENNSSNETGNCGPACEGETLIIEVMGKDCPEGPRFRLFDTSNREQQEQLENQNKLELVKTRLREERAAAAAMAKAKRFLRCSASR